MRQAGSGVRYVFKRLAYEGDRWSVQKIRGGTVLQEGELIVPEEYIEQLQKEARR